MSNKQQKVIKRLLLLGTVLAALKIIFVDYTMDEEYQIVMAYRNLSGDSLFGTMWEPHQTSAFLCVWLMRFFHFVTGSYDGVLIYLRICTTFIQIGLSLWLYQIMCYLLQKEYAFYISLIYLNIVPKLIQIPEFSNMQVWFWSILVFALIEYEKHSKYRKRSFWICLAGVAMALEILSYPSCLVLFPLVLVYLFFTTQKMRPPLLFSMTCVVCALIWLGTILQNVGLEEFLQNIHHIVSFDLTHQLDVSANNKLLFLLQGAGWELQLILICACVAAIGLWIARHFFSYGKGMSLSKDLPLFIVGMILAAEVIQVVYWGILKQGYEKPQVHLLIALLAGVAVWHLTGEARRQLRFGIVSAIVTLLAVLYMSDLGFFYAIPHALLGTIFGLAMIVLALSNQVREKSDVWIRILLISFVFVSIFGKGFTLRGGRSNAITGVAGIMRSGPAMGVMADYMCAYIYNCDYEDFRQNLEPQQRCLIVSNLVGSQGTTPYLFADSEICHFSIVDPTSYDERLLTYWEHYPQKKPDVIVVDCWYGGLLEDEHNWIMQYIEKEFGYSEVVDGRYVRFYKK